MVKFIDYNNNNILNFVASILEKYSIPHQHNIIGSLSFRSKKTLVFLIDAMGYNQFIREFPKYNPLRLETVFPSTTATALTSIFTEKEPIEHGILGFTTYIREYGIIANCISMKSTLSNYDVSNYFLQESTIFQQLYSSNINSYSLIPHSISNSGLSKILYSGSKVIPYYSFNDIFSVLDSLVCNNENQFVMVYYPNYDTICHKYGPDSANASNELRKVFLEIKKFSDGLKSDHNIFVIADHGQIATPKDKFKFWKNYPLIAKNFIIPPFCEPRVNMFFSSRDLTSELNNEFSDFILYNKEEMLNKKLFGSGNKFENRLGDHILIFKGNTVVMSQLSPFYPPPSFLGMHGSITEDEMYVPLIQLK
jgi:predicted AlkP superfamily pyrophosphatase or phosphodiesterase